MRQTNFQLFYSQEVDGIRHLKHGAKSTSISDLLTDYYKVISFQYKLFAIMDHLTNQISENEDFMTDIWQIDKHLPKKQSFSYYCEKSIWFFFRSNILHIDSCSIIGFFPAQSVDWIDNHLIVFHVRRNKIDLQFNPSCVNFPIYVSGFQYSRSFLPLLEWVDEISKNVSTTGS